MGKEMYKFTKAKVLKAIENSRGSVTVISKRLGCSWHIGKKWVDKWEDTQIAWKDELEKNIDKAESNIYDSLEEGDVQTSKWFLGTIGKNRGYSEKQSIEIDLKGSMLEKMARLFFDNDE